MSILRCHAAVQIPSWTTGSRDAATVLDFDGDAYWAILDCRVRRLIDRGPRVVAKRKGLGTDGGSSWRHFVFWKTG